MPLGDRANSQDDGIQVFDRITPVNKYSNRVQHAATDVSVALWFFRFERLIELRWFVNGPPMRLSLDCAATTGAAVRHLAAIVSKSRARREIIKGILYVGPERTRKKCLDAFNVFHKSYQCSNPFSSRSSNSCRTE